MSCQIAHNPVHCCACSQALPTTFELLRGTAEMSEGHCIAVVHKAIPGAVLKNTVVHRVNRPPLSIQTTAKFSVYPGPKQQAIKKPHRIMLPILFHETHASIVLGITLNDCLHELSPTPIHAILQDDMSKHFARAPSLPKDIRARTQRCPKAQAHTPFSSSEKRARPDN